MKAKTKKRKYISQNQYSLQKLTPAQVRPLTWKYATKIVDTAPYTHMHRLGSADGLGSPVQVGLAIALGILLLPVLAGAPVVLAYLAG